MFKKLKLLTFLLIIGTQAMLSETLIDKVHSKKENNLLLIIGDGVGLNVNCDGLLNKNLNKLHQLITKKNLRGSKIKKVEVLIFGETIRSIGEIEAKRAAKLFRLSKELLSRLEIELRKGNSSNSSKDVIGALKHLQMMIDQKYKNRFDQISVVMLSNLRDSFRAKDEFIDLKPMNFPKTTLNILGASGLECLGANTTQIQTSEAQIVEYYSKKLQSVKTNILTIY